MSKHVRDNWQHFEHVVSKDMAHMHYPAAGSMVDYIVRDTDNHIQTLLIGSVLDVEGFRSWQKADALVKEFIPDFDSESTALKGDGQKGEKKSHIATFDNVCLRPCSRHRVEELMRGGAGADAKRFTKMTYQSAMKSRTGIKVKRLLRTLRSFPNWGARQAWIRLTSASFSLMCCSQYQPFVSGHRRIESRTYRLMSNSRHVQSKLVGDRRAATTRETTPKLNGR